MERDALYGLVKETSWSFAGGLFGYIPRSLPNEMRQEELSLDSKFSWGWGHTQLQTKRDFASVTWALWCKLESHGLFFFNALIYGRGHPHITMCVWRSEDSLKNHFSPTMWVLGIKFGSSGLVASWVILPQTVISQGPSVHCCAWAYFPTCQMGEVAIESGPCTRIEQHTLAQVHRLLLPLALLRTVQATRMLGMLESSPC